MAKKQTKTKAVKTAAPKGKRGRPAVYTGKKFLGHVATLVKNHGASQAREILNAEPGSDLAAQRSASLVPVGLGISLPTVLKIAKSAGVKLKRGRRAGSKSKAA